MTIAIIQARTGSSRLPGKILLDLCGKPLIGHLLERLKQVPSLDRIVVATTESAKDDPLAAYLSELGAPFFRGDELDVLGRFSRCAEGRGGDLILRFTADNPLIDPQIIERAIIYFRKHQPDYLKYGVGLPMGMELELFTRKALETADREATDPLCREHVTPYFYWNPERFKCMRFAVEENHSDLRWTLDTEDDYTLIRAIYQELYPKNPRFSCADVLAAYRLHPEWRQVNAHIEQIKVEKPGEE